MGLDIVYYAHLEAVSSDEVDNDESYAYICVNPDFEDQADGLETGLYDCERSGSFRAGSYRGYNLWRSRLAILIDKTDYDIWDNSEGPFAELINFSDCEGIIGPVTSAKLAKDFSEHQEIAERKEDSYFLYLYNEWRKAFETAANGGCVRFC